MSSLIDKNPGIFNPLSRYAVTNITEEPHEVIWNGEVITALKPHQTIELPHHLANKVVDELVDKIMIGKAKLDEVEMLKQNPAIPNPRSPQGMSLGVPAARKVWEDQIVKEIEVDPDSPEVRLMRSQVKEQILGDMSRSAEKPKPVESVTPALSEFADLTNTAKAA